MKTLLSLVLALTAVSPVLRADSWDRDRRSGGRVVVFQNADYRGDSLELYPGDSLNNLSGKNFPGGAKLNDAISSIRIEGDVEVYVYENADYRGNALRVTENVRDLTGRLVPGSVNVSWNDRISSLRVESTRRGGGGRDHDRPRPGNSIPPEKAEKTIKAGFQDVLGRDPSGSELNDLRDRFVDGSWNDKMLRDYLRTEDRYRTELADKIIYRAFRDIFGRDPDARALQIYRRNMLERKWTEGDVRDDLRKSPEARGYLERQKQQH